MNRRRFLRSKFAQSALAGLSAGRCLSWRISPSSNEWRTFEVITRVELLKPVGVSHIWLPVPLIRDTSYQKTISDRFKAEMGNGKVEQGQAKCSRRRIPNLPAQKPGFC